MDHNGSLFGPDPIPEGPDEPDQGLRRIGDSKVRPGGEVEVPQDALFTALFKVKDIRIEK